MKTSEHKIKHRLPFEELPAYLRQLAIALENKSDNLPEELKNLPEPIAKFEIKGRARDEAWELKIKFKAESAPEPLKPAEETAAETVALTKVKLKYKPLKKKMKSSFKNMGESLEALTLPESELVKAFLADSDRLLSFSGEKYGETRYPAYREACRQLAKAYDAKSLVRFKSAYANLDQLMQDCHKEYK